MEIQIQDLEYKINEEIISKESTKLLHRNLCNTPGISKDRFIDWNSKKWESWFINCLNLIGEILSQYKETHTDGVLNTINFLQNLNDYQINEDIDKDIYSDYWTLLGMEDEKSVCVNGDEKILVLQEFNCFLYSFFNEFLISIGFNSVDQTLLNSFDSNPNLTNSIFNLNALENNLPISRRNYSKIHFHFISKNIHRIDYSCSIEIHQLVKFSMNQFIDNICDSTRLISKDKKRHLKTWFHKNGQVPKLVTPMLFDDTDEAFYVAYFIKSIGAAPGEKNIRF